MLCCAFISNNSSSFVDGSWLDVGSLQRKAKDATSSFSTASTVHNVVIIAAIQSVISPSTQGYISRTKSNVPGPEDHLHA